MMKILRDMDLSPEENLAMDELMLAKAEKGEAGETLRFWSCEDHFVVLGRGCSAEEECFLPKCREDGVKVLRRISGGGTVLQGRGCLNFSAVLSYDRDENYTNIVRSYEKIIRDLSKAFRGKGLGAEFMPVSDLAAGGKKFSGNAQARKRKYFLHHGTVLHGMELSKIDSYIKYPPREPGYRQGRAHGEFVGNIGLSEKDIKEAVIEAFSGKEENNQSFPYPSGELEDLVRNKYSLEGWNLGL